MNPCNNLDSKQLLNTNNKCKFTNEMVNLNNSNGNNQQSIVDNKILNMMLKMGYKSGFGLGKHAQGIVNPVQIPIKLNHNGLGLTNLQKNNIKSEAEEILIEETVQWLENKTNLDIDYNTMQNWVKKGPQKLTVHDETHFCNPDILHKVLKAKAVLDEFNEIDLMKARSRANPFESIKSAFFMNRAALKMANIDACTDFMFSDIDRNADHRRKDGPYYFADVCAGPGGFSEYILWRKGWSFKGFGLTLKADNDFKVADSNCASGATFQALYGAKDDGDIFCPENIEDFANKVLIETENEGVHFMMSDGGFSVEGNENLQEVLSKQLYICQCLVALEIIRENGHFVSKLFDIFTPFSVGLIFLMYHCFKKVAIVKPNSSRPANSERYLICNGLRKTFGTTEIRKYIRKLVNDFWNMKVINSNDINDILEIVPISVMKNNVNFTEYIIHINNSFANKQVASLLKLVEFCKNPNLVDTRQDDLRVKCLNYWRIPDKTKNIPSYLTVNDLLVFAVNKPEFMMVQPRNINTIEEFEKLIIDVNDWHFISMNCGSSTNICNFYAAISGSRVYRLQKQKWVKVKNLNLVAGTILYGEMVKELTLDTNLDVTERKSLHVIDALRLGDLSLADLSFAERLLLIQTYSKAVNFETNSCNIKIRPKCVKPLNSIIDNCPINYNLNEDKYFAILPNTSINVKKINDYFVINSLLLLKTDETQSFKTTYVLRVQIHINEDQKLINSDNENKVLKLHNLLYYLKKNM